ncbi:MAG TPA: DUF1800 domain-containing protein, partial [Burkholderiales bacterium]|nr:DUF1800 domain-containing protein [Burkholderiales bacterium]
EDARHLLNRTGFDAQLREIDEFARLTRREGVERLLAGVQPEASTPPPAWVKEWTDPRVVRAMADEERKAFVRLQIERALELKAWWLAEMLATRSPFTERMTLFWHNHFASSLQKVRSPPLMHRQNALLRRHALGNFGELLHAVSRDPAMIVYLDSATNRRGQPNENFARELMELFTLGEGKYSEQDIREAARAFTGWSIEPQTGEYRFRPRQHDDGVKQVLGRAVRSGDEVLDVLLAQPATAEYLAARLWREFVSPQPKPEELARVAAAFRGSGYEIRAAMRALLLTPAFWAPENRGVLIKSPTDLVVGTMRQFGIEVSDPLPFVFLMRALGQDLLSPPNVKGWPGGEAWINSTTLLARKQYLERLLRVEDTRMLMQKNMDSLKPGARRMIQAIAELHFSARDWMAPFEGRETMVPVVLLAGAPAGNPSGSGIEYLRALLADPLYQLK